MTFTQAKVVSSFQCEPDTWWFQPELSSKLQLWRIVDLNEALSFKTSVSCFLQKVIQEENFKVVLPSTLKTCSYEESFYLEENVIKSHDSSCGFRPPFRGKKKSYNSVPFLKESRTDAEAEAPILWLPDAKSRLIRKNSNFGKDGGQEEKRAREDEMLDGIIDSMDMSLNKFQEIVKDREPWCAEVHGVTKNWTQLSN